MNYIFQKSVVILGGSEKEQEITKEREITNQIIENKMKNKVQKITVPYLRNRLVLFRSDLVHRTSKKIRFKTGYVNRRINLTWLLSQWLKFSNSKYNPVY